MKRIQLFGMLLAATAGNCLARQPAQTAQVPPGFTMERTGTKDDFAYFEGGWTTDQHRLVATGDRRGQ